VSNPHLILHRVREPPSKIPHILVKSPKLWYKLGSPEITLSSPVIDNHSPKESLLD